MHTYFGQNSVFVRTQKTFGIHRERNIVEMPIDFLVDNALLETDHCALSITLNFKMSRRKHKFTPNIKMLTERGANTVK